MPRGVVTVGAITCGLRFARKAVKFRFNSVIDSIYYFSVEEIHSMANGHGSAWYFYRNASTTKYLQNASLLNTWPATGLLYPADAPIQHYLTDVGMSNPVPLQPHCTACDNCAPPLLLSCLLQSPPLLCCTGRALPTPISSTVLP